jgi:hypothetical protein
MWYAGNMQSKAKTVAEYLKELPEDRRAAIEAVRAVMLKNMDKGYQEGMSYGMIGYSVPHAIFPSGYHCDPKQPLPFAGLASQKQYMSVYLTGLYTFGDRVEGKLLKWFTDAWKKSGKKLDMGKACIRFKTLDDLPLEVIGEAIRRVPVQECIDQYVEALRSIGKGPDGKPLKDSGAQKKAARTPARKPGSPKGAAGKKVGKKAGGKKKTKK